MHRLLGLAVAKAGAKYAVTFGLVTAMADITNASAEAFNSVVGGVGEAVPQAIGTSIHVVINLVDIGIDTAIYLIGALAS
jgi:hypothetical protein